jgi:hypothetical protein
MIKLACSLRARSVAFKTTLTLGTRVRLMIIKTDRSSARHSKGSPVLDFDGVRADTRIGL